jgi:hypothetical protein
MVFEAAAALCRLVFGQGGGKARRRPALVVGLGESEVQTGGQAHHPQNATIRLIGFR